MKVMTSVAILLVCVIGLLSLGSRAASRNDVVLTAKNSLVFSGPVSASSVAKNQKKLAEISNELGSNDVIYLVIDSPGGSVLAGLEFITFAKALPQKVKPLCLYCASMGYQIFQALDERLVLPSSQLMSHRATLGGIGGQIPGEIDSRLNSIRRILDEIDSGTAARVGMSFEQYRKAIYNELYLWGREAVEQKHADRMPIVRCSKELANSVRQETFNTFFGAVSVEFSNCPLISGPLSVKLNRTDITVPEVEVHRAVMKQLRTVTMEF